VVNSEVTSLNSAVLAGEMISDEDLPPAEFHPGIGPLDHIHEPDYRGRIEHRGRRVDHHIILLENLGFAIEDKDDRPADVAHVEWFIVGIEHKHRMMAIESVMAIAVLMVYGACIVHLIPGPSIRCCFDMATVMHE
jgi:hypothetical protein